VDAERASARFEVQNRHRQPFGIVHGGVYAALAEGLAIRATYMQVAGNGKIAVGSSNYTSFLRPVSEGIVTATARAVHQRPHQLGLGGLSSRPEAGKRCAVSRVTLAVDRSSASIAVGDRQAAGRDRTPSWRCGSRAAPGALVFGQVDHAHHAPDLVLGESASDQLLGVEVLLDVALEIASSTS